MSGEDRSDFQGMAQVFKALSDENRLRIIVEVAASPDSEGLSVTDIVKRLDISQPLASHHLKELKYNGILKPSRRGPFVHYGLRDDRILKLVAIAGEVLQGQAHS